MKLLFKPEAEEVLLEIALWVEQRNTSGSGLRFIERFIDRIASFAHPNITYALCKNLILASRGLQCISLDKWTIAFKSDRKNFIVYAIMWGPGLK